jgi:hypothetical protein
VTNNCGQSVDCGTCPPPQITTFTATPTTIDRGASELATLSWSTTTATTCSIDNGVGSVPCSGSKKVGPSATTTYTLTASGPGGGPVTAQVTVSVQYCHAVTTAGNFACPNASVYCLSVPIVATSSAHAQAACEACFGAGNCHNSTSAEGAPVWYAIDSPVVSFYAYGFATTASDFCTYYFQRAGDIFDGAGCEEGRWAP